MSVPNSTVVAGRDGTRRGYLIALGLLAAAFAFRVAAQALQIVAPTDLLPAAAAWQGSGLPYSVLLASQLAILAVMGWSLLRVARGRRVIPAASVPAVMAAAAVYLAFMAFRLVAGVSFLADHRWFAAPLSATFHLVLASFLMLLTVRDRADHGSAGETATREVVRWLAYPATMTLAVTVYCLLADAGWHVVAAAFAAAAIGGAMIRLQERALPYRESWRPSRREMVVDRLFLVFVQILLPNSLALVAAVALTKAPALIGTLHGLWPHRWPLAAQVALMVLGADFLRYWLHRAMHGWAPLWRLHKLHHAPERLYWMNTARFHPLEKALQFLFDALPFIVLGVGSDVLALHFVLYAVNGFYQHGNCDVRLGWLDHIVSGPELHRWHHSCVARESSTNFGNNLIVWDTIFGTRFKPSDRSVGAIGIEPLPATALARGGR